MGCKSSKYRVDESVKPLSTGYNLTQLSTGDVVLFSQTNTVAQSIIHMALRSKWTHVGIVIDLPSLYPRQSPMLLESCNNYEDDLVDILTGETITTGVRLVCLRDRIQSVQNREIAVRRLQFAESFNTEGIDAVAVMGTVASFCGKPYEKSTLQIALSATPFNQPRDETSLFCSELVAAVLQQLRLMNSAKSSNSYTPKTFTKKKLRLTCGHYRPLTYIQRY